MKNNYFREIGKCFVWIATQANHIKQELNQELRQRYTHKVVQISICPKIGVFEIEFTVSCVTKPLFFKTPVRSILKDETTLACFSPFDVRLITVLAMKEYYDSIKANESFYKVTQQDFDESGRVLFTIEFQGKTFQKSAYEIMYDEEILKNLSINDVANIAFTAGCEQSDVKNRILNAATNF